MSTPLDIRTKPLLKSVLPFVPQPTLLFDEEQTTADGRVRFAVVRRFVRLAR